MPARPLVRPLVAACLALTAACGGYSPPGSRSLRVLPRPDACGELPRAAVEKALDGPVGKCTADAQEETHGVRFQVSPKRRPAALVVSYQRRYAPKTGLDLWEVHGFVEGEKTLLIGVGEGALFDPVAATVLAVSEHLLVTVGVQSAVKIPREGLPDRLLPVLEAALDLGEEAVGATAPPEAPFSPRPGS
ncbi:hypothetical protein [Actinocorallia populi]|uniref:hypothetical protein n=1 Tax=Actinocorallia populi TaxID=2079200 RepID=UPI0013009638|nr:hypothetical protein [Actinocorallia populi]